MLELRTVLCFALVHFLCALRGYACGMYVCCPCKFEGTLAKNMKLPAQPSQRRFHADAKCQKSCTLTRGWQSTHIPPKQVTMSPPGLTRVTTQAHPAGIESSASRKVWTLVVGR